MTPQQGRGVREWAFIASAALERLSRETALELIEGLTDEELADMMAAYSAAGVAADGPAAGNLFYESAARRLRGESPAEVRQ